MKQIYILLLCASVLFGQYKQGRQMPAIGILQGTVIDSSSGEPIEYASVSVVNLRNNNVVTGSISDSRGTFYISEIPLGKYKIVVEFIGFEKEVIEPINLFPGKGIGAEQSLGEIALSVSSVQMAEVDVVGDTPQYIQTIDKKIFFTDQSLSVQGGTASDALKKIPSVDVDIDGNISVRGDQNVTVLIDGKPSGLTHGDRQSIVDNIPAAMIDRVEVITNPSAKYDPDGMAGIINIILKRGKFEGMNGNTSVSIGQFNQYNVSGLVNYRMEKWNAFANGSLSKGNHVGYSQRSFVVQFPSFSDSSSQRNERAKVPQTGSFKLGGDYFINKQNTLSFSGTYSNHTNKTVEEAHYLYPVSYEVYSNETDVGSTKEIDARFTRDYDNPKQKLDLEASYSKTDDRQEQTYQEDGETHNHEAHGGEISGHSHFDEWRTHTVIKLDYTHPFGENTLMETGMKSTIQRFNTDVEYLEVPYAFLYDEDIHAFYATLGHDLKNRWGLKAGIRVEQANTHADVYESSNVTQDTVNIFTTIIDNAINQSPYNNPYFKLYPSLFWLYTFNEKDQLQFGYSKRVNRPRRRSINPFPRDFFDTAMIRNGNPYLRSEFSDVLELNFSHFTRKLSLNSSLYYKNTKDRMRSWDSDFLTVNDTIYEVHTADNAGNAESHGIELMVNYRPMPLMSFMVSLTTWNSRMYGSGESDLDGTAKGYFAFGMSTFTIPNIARIEFSGRYRGPMKITDGSIGSNIKADLSIQKGFMDKRLNMTLKISDVFDSGKFTVHTEREAYNEVTDVISYNILDAERRRRPRTVHLVLSYNFGKLEQKKRWGRGKGDREGGGGMDMDF